MTKPRILCWFSCGAPSACASKLTIRDYGDTHDVRVVCCDTRPSENSDNYRFSSQVEKWLGQSIVYIRNDQFTTVDDVFEKHRYMSGVKGARCTVELKKKPRFAYQRPDDIHVFGLTADEGKRIKEFTQLNPELRLLWQLQKYSITKSMCNVLIAGAGIELPLMYRLGFDNNNCPGCVKAKSPWYWDMIRTHFPDVFLRRCRQSRELGVRLVECSNEVLSKLHPSVTPKGKKRLIFLDELPIGPFKKHRKKERISCGPECGIKP